MKSSTQQTNYLTVKDISAYLNVSLAKAYEFTHRKDFPVCRFGRTIRIPQDAFLEWVEMRTHIPAELTARTVA